MPEILVATYIVIDVERYEKEWPAEEKTPEEIEVQRPNGRTIKTEHRYEDGTFQSKFWTPSPLGDMIHQEIIQPKTVDDFGE